MVRNNKKRKEKASSSDANESVYTHTNSFIPALSSAVGSQNPADPDVQLPSPISRSNLPASTQSGGIATYVTRFLSAIRTGIATHLTKIGPNANFEGATAIAFGSQNTVTYNSHNSYHIRLGDQELTGTQVEKFMTGLVALPGKMGEVTSKVSKTSLPRAPAAYNDYKPQKEREPCFEGTRKAVLKEIANWFLVMGKSRIYTLSGLAGIGKSTIAYTVAQRAARLGLLGASFFFSKQEAERRSAEKFFTTIAFHLCVYDDEFAYAIRTVLATNKGEDATTKDPETQLKVLIIEPLRDLVRSRTQPVVIVVDALDECEDKDARIILRSLGQLVYEIPSFKILLTTRPRPHIDDLLSSHDVFYLHNIEDKVINNDIRSYLKFRLSTEQVKTIFPTLRKPWSATGDDIDSLVRSAGKLFIVASTSVLFILDEKVRNPAYQMDKLRSKLTLNHTPLPALGDFYSIILHAIVPASSDLVERYQKVIGAIVLLCDPLPVDALADFINMQEEDICGVLDNLRSVILLGPDDTPYIYHKSFSDWIMDVEYCKDKDYRIDPMDGHTWLTTRCLQTMNDRLKRNILNIDGVMQFMTKSEALKQDRIEEEFRKKFSPALQYGCKYWPKHLMKANVDHADLIINFKIFVVEHGLHWIESLSWITSIAFYPDFHGVDEFAKVTSGLRELTSDALRFLSKFWPLIVTLPLSTYHSALPFTPTESLFYQRYNMEMVDNICRIHGGPKRWSEVINSGLHGQHVDRIVFSEHGGFISSSAALIKIWSSTMGMHHGTINADRIAVVANNYDTAVLTRDMINIEVKDTSWSANIEVSGPILSIALSPNSRRLAVALSNGSVNLWEAGVSKQIAGFDGFGSDHDSSYHLAFSPNDNWIAYRLAGGGFALRNAIDREHITDRNIHRLALCPVDSWLNDDWIGYRLVGGDFASRNAIEEEHVTDGNNNYAMVHRLVFSPDGSQLASLFIDDGHKHILTLWNCIDRKLLDVVQDIGSELAFSADGSLIATGGLNNLLKLWSNNDEDQNLHFIETADFSSLKSISCLAFSQDDMLAIGSADTGIILYDVAKHSFITTIPFKQPTAIAFSSDCTFLAIGNEDGDLRLLDVPTIKASTQTSQENPAPVNALVFSPDCSRLVSGSEDGIIRIWNTSCATEPIATRICHSSRITTIAFTPNGCQFASGDANGTIKLWSDDDYTLSNTIQWPISGELNSLAVGNYLLAAATKDSISLWDLQESCIIDRLGECGALLLSFSNQDENLLLASFDSDSNIVTVWDVGNRTPSTTFSIGPIAERMVFSPDDSRLFVHDGGNEGLLIFNVVKKVLQNSAPISSGAIDQGVVPSWKGIPVWMRCSNNHYSIRGWFSEDDGNYTCETVCQLPGDLDVVKAAYGLSMFALLCKNGSLVLLQSS